MSWFSNLNPESLTNLVQNAVSQVESSLDKVLTDEAKKDDFFKIMFSSEGNAIKAVEERNVESDAGDVNAILASPSIESLIHEPTNDVVSKQLEIQKEMFQRDAIPTTADAGSESIAAIVDIAITDTNEDSDPVLITRKDNNEDGHKLQILDEVSTEERNHADNLNNVNSAAASAAEEIDDKIYDSNQVEITEVAEMLDGSQLDRDKAILEVREHELLVAKTEISRLHTELEALKQLVDQANLKAAQLEGSNADLASRYKAAEKKLESNTGTGNTDIARALSEKETSIKGLLAEGESLSKQILASNNTIKRIKSRENETKKELETAVTAMASKTAEYDKLKAEFDVIVGKEKQQSGIIS